ncbi:MAG: Flp pilus assembly complex ATPase component TadA [Bacilli bacterium]|nr:Flp pilus assembly complex ATPase component TadA [Bacilli bacterium]
MDTNFEQIDFGPLKPYLADDDVTDISYDNGGQIHLKTLSKGIFRIENPAIDNAFMEKLAFQCSNVMGKTFNMAHPFLDAESAELRLAFVHETVARNGVACVVRKTPAKIRLQKEKIVADKYVELDIVEFLEQCVIGHCNMIVSGETGSGKTELVKYLASKIAENEKVITIEDTLELHLDRIFPHRDIVAMKTNNIASYTDILEACMRQNPKWILLSEVRSAEAVLAVRNSISSGHYILSTIHADKASSIPNRLYSLLETNQDLDQFMSSICRYIQLGIYVRGYTDKATRSFKREIAEVTEFYVNSETNKAGHNVIYRKGADGKVIRNNPSPYLIDYLEVQGVFLPKELQNMAGDADDEAVVNVNKPLSEMDIADNQTVTFSNNGARIAEKSAEVEPIVNPIASTAGVQFNTSPVPEISTPQPSMPSSTYMQNSGMAYNQNTMGQTNTVVSQAPKEQIDNLFG